MEKVDVLQLVRENRDKYKQHIQKIKELEETDKQLNYQNMYKEYSKNNIDKLTTIPEGGSETFSNRKIEYFNDNNKSQPSKFVESNEKNSVKHDNYIYDKLYESNDEPENVEEVLLDNDYDDNKLNYSSNEREKDYKFNNSYILQEDQVERENPTKNIKNNYISDGNDYDSQHRGNDKHNSKSDDEDYIGNRSISYDEIDENNDNQYKKTHEKHQNNNYKYKIDNIYDQTESSDEDKITPQSIKQTNPNPNRVGIKLPSPRFFNTNTKGVNLTRSNNSVKSGSFNKDTKRTIKPNKSIYNNSEKRPYTALTYSTIKKIKSNSDKSIKSKLNI